MPKLIRWSLAAALALSAGWPAACSRSSDPDPVALAEYLIRHGYVTGQDEAPEDLLVGPPRGPIAQRVALTVESGTGIPDMDFGPGVTDPYVIVEYDGRRWQTSIVEGSLEPVWGDTFVIDVRPGGVLTLTLMDDDFIGSDMLGVMSMPLEPVRVGERHTFDVAFRHGEMGTITLTLVGLARP